MRSIGFFCEHELQGILHSDPKANVTYKCPRCPKTFAGPVRDVLDAYREEQQWFWDFVVSTSQEDAAALVCKRRPYVIAADAITPSETIAMIGELEVMKIEHLDKNFKEVTHNA